MIFFIMGLILGCFVGAIFGVFAFSFCIKIKVNDEYAKRYAEDKEREQE